MVTAVHYMEQSVVDSKLRHHFHVIKRTQYCSKECIFSQIMLLSKWHGVEFKGSTLFFITSFEQCKTNTFIVCLELFSCVKWRLTWCNILYSTMMFIVKYYHNQSWPRFSTFCTNRLQQVKFPIFHHIIQLQFNHARPLSGGLFCLQILP